LDREWAARHVTEHRRQRQYKDRAVEHGGVGRRELVGRRKPLL
jgi:hypothetical protein